MNTTSSSKTVLGKHPREPTAIVSAISTAPASREMKIFTRSNRTVTQYYSEDRKLISSRAEHKINADEKAGRSIVSSVKFNKNGFAYKHRDVENSVEEITKAKFKKIQGTSNKFNFHIRKYSKMPTNTKNKIFFNYYGSIEIFWSQAADENKTSYLTCRMSGLSNAVFPPFNGIVGNYVPHWAFQVFRTNYNFNPHANPCMLIYHIIHSELYNLLYGNENAKENLITDVNMNPNSAPDVFTRSIA